MLSGKTFQILITRLERKLLSRAEYTCVLASFIELPLVRSIHECEKIITIKMYPVMQNNVMVAFFDDLRSDWMGFVNDGKFLRQNKSYSARN